MKLSAGVSLTALTLALPLAAPRAEARVEASSAYTKAQTFSGALRFLRVDRGYEVVEQDANAAYLLFRYPLPGQSAPVNGAIEIVETPAGVKLFVELPKLPGYHESVLRDALIRKLKAEYGTPPARPPANRRNDKPKPKDEPRE